MHSLTAVQLAFIFPASILAIHGIWHLFQRKLDRKGLRLPPGPKQIPILGNILSINREKPWKTYTEWRAVYGDIFSLRILDQDIVVLGSQSVAVELLEKRSHIYSDRPYIATLKPYGIDCIFSFARYGQDWRACRRILHQSFRPNAATNFRPMQLRKARQMAMNMLEHPDRYEHNYVHFSTSISLSTAYDYEIKGQDDKVVQNFVDFSAVSMPVATPESAALLKLFPFLLHIPDWFPGSSLKHEARRSRDMAKELTEVPYRDVQERMKANDGREIISMVSDHIGRMEEDPDQPRNSELISNLKKAAVSTLFAGSETTVSTLMVFTLAMMRNPRVWKRAQAEIDAVVGTGRLPDFSDRAALPYVDATIRETLRWWPVVPLGLWHSTTDNDVYDGHYIPKGTTIVANIWAMSRDEVRFPNAERFAPERFLDEQNELNDNDPMDFVFGFGRRICPGRYAADASLFISVATMLAAFDFYVPKDGQGKDLDFEVEWVNGLTHHPMPFPCSISPRPHVNKSFLGRMNVELD